MPNARLAPQRAAALRVRAQAAHTGGAGGAPRVAAAAALPRVPAPAPARPARRAWDDEREYAETRKPVAEASTLPGAVYHDEGFAALEHERLWPSSWVACAEAAELREPGTVKAVTVAGSSLLLTAQHDGVRAFHNVCRHRGSRILRDDGDEGSGCTHRGTLLCPYHHWSFTLDGELHKTGAATEFDDAFREENGLYAVRAEVALGMVFVNLDGSAPPLTEWLGDLLVALDGYDFDNLVATEYRKTYAPAANWKVLVENYLEYYHLPSVHPALCKVSGVTEHKRRQGEGMYMCFATDPLTEGGTPLDPGRLPPFEGIGEANEKTAWHIAIFPNTFFSIYPNHFYRVILQPDGPGRTLEHATLLTHPGAAEAPGAKEELEAIFAFMDNVNNEDIDICEEVQKGSATTQYTGGRFASYFEEPLHRFQNMVIDKVAGDPELAQRIPPGDGHPY